ncbi:hypothetical protein PsYK624_011190 [Phanerochaete sordida]|uniref:Uncharacterized protein n=1 Tax=Phanerochaete sordida TaxID=48140 RepID=A0A9P3FXM4_9APHY|nr:hypothetical protein PsYK624_011190 [Phanerochaete sordida]
MSSRRAPSPCFRASTATSSRCTPALHPPAGPCVGVARVGAAAHAVQPGVHRRDIRRRRRLTRELGLSCGVVGCPRSTCRQVRTGRHVIPREPNRLPGDEDALDDAPAGGRRRRTGRGQLLIEDVRAADARMSATWRHAPPLDVAISITQFPTWCALLREIADVKYPGERVAEARDAAKQIWEDFARRLEHLMSRCEDARVSGPECTSYA